MSESGGGFTTSLIAFISAGLLLRVKASHYSVSRQVPVGF